ncbi:MAG: Ice-structuring protein [Gemmiger sp.]
MANSREEQLRNNRRLARQLLGAGVVVLVLIGLLTVVGWAVAGVRTALDDSDRKQSYADRLYGLVMFDPLPFEDVNSVDQTLFKQAAIWGTVYQIQNSGAGLDSYERDADTGCVILPQLEVDSYITSLLGPGYVIEEGSFETAEMNYLYSEEKQGYLVPITGSVGLYTPQVEKITTRNGKTYVTVGYIPTANTNPTLSFTTATEPTKYMDYVFERGEKRQWYLTALQESEMQPAATPTPTPMADAVTVDPQTMVENNVSSEAGYGTDSEESRQEGN